MSESTTVGRHRAPGRHNPVTEITGMIARVGEGGVKASAIVAASGGLVAAFALPAQAATTAPNGSTSTSTSALGASSLTATPALQQLKVAETAIVAAPAAVTAPEAAAPTALPAVGTAGVGAVEKPAPPPPPVVTPTAAPAAAAASSAPAPASFTVPSSVGGGVLGIAAAYSGIYYVYGGTTPAGFDCSGYVQFVFAQAGISLPRTAAAQASVTTIVSDPQPGDLVFFGGPGGVYHVGIYAGGGMMYDSPTTGQTTGLHGIWSSNVFYGRV